MPSNAFALCASGALLASLASTAAADLDYPDFTSPQNLTFVGQTSTASGLLRLTDSVGYETGAAWHDFKQVVAGGFDTTFEFRMTPAGGADGMAFVIQNDNAQAIGLCGGSQGFSSGTSAGCTGGINQDIANALAVSLDVWSNGEYADPDDNHVAVHVQQTGTNELVHHANALGSYKPAFDLNDGQVHSCRVTYDGVGTLEVYLENLTAPVLSVSVDISQVLSLDNGAAWVGFTGATGGSVQIHAVKSWSFSESAGFLFASASQLSLGSGGKCDFKLSAGAAQAGRPYLLLGSHSGTSPGFPIDATQTLPLNIDAYWFHTLANPNTPPLSGSFGVLDSGGKASASFTLPAGVNPAFAGISIHHAFVVIDATSPGGAVVTYTSDAAGFALAP